MRTLSTEHEKVFASGNYSCHVRVSVKDAGGTWRDLTTYGGYNWVDSVDIGESVDEPHRTANIKLKREIEELSLATLMETSPLNLEFEYPGTYAALLDAGSEIKVEAGLGYEGDSSPVEWLMVFHGYIDVPDWGAGESVALECVDQSANLSDVFIEEERAYGLSTGGGLRVWRDDEPFALGELMTPQNANGYYYEVTTAGTSGTSEPTWPTSVSATVSDGTITWECAGTTTGSGVALETVLQQLFDDNATGETLYTPSSPGWNLNPWTQDRTHVLDAASALVEQIGWDLRSKWKAAASDFAPTLYEPDRTNTTPDRTFTKSEYREVSRCAIDRTAIRNAIRIWYRDTSDLWPDGTPKRKKVEVTDSTSINRFGRFFAEAAEEGTAQLDTSTEATALANAMLSDLAWPLAELVVVDQFAPFVELGDLYRFSANGRHFSADQDRAVVAYEHNFQPGGAATTTYTLRGKPSGGYKKWLKKMSHPGVGQSHKQTVPSSGSVSISVAGSLEGGKATLAIPAPAKDAAEIADGADYHMSASSGFTPDSSTLVGSGKQKTIEIHNLKPGKTYYVKAVPRGRNSGRTIIGTPTAEQSFVAGYLSEQHFNPALGMKPGPLNGSFESYWDTTAIPDHWEMVTGNYGSGADCFRNTSSHGGAYSLELKATATATKVRSALFAVQAGRVYDFTAWLKRVNDSANTTTLEFEEYTTADLVTPSTTQNLSTQTNSSLGTIWNRVVARKTLHADTAFCRISVKKDTASNTYGLLVDDVTFAPLVDTFTSALDGIVPASGGGTANFLRADGTWALPTGYALNVLAANLATLVDSTSYYFGGTAGAAPSTTEGNQRLYIPKAGTIKAVIIFGHAGTAGSNESWELLCRKNGSAGASIQALSSINANRVWTNTALNLAVARGDYIEIHSDRVSWGTNPANVTFGGSIYIE